MKEELVYQIALTMIPELGAVKGRILAEHFNQASDIFKARKKELALLEGIGENFARKIKSWNGFAEAEAEAAFVEKHQIQTLFIKEDHYPKRLLHCYDPPTLLYYKGNASLNNGRILSIIGTRNHTEYGKLVTEQLIKRLQNEQVLIVSGLAFGIDAIAHKTSLHYQIPTVGVMAHGMDTIYPSQHRPLAHDMMEMGGLLTEYCRQTKPDKHNFPKRNRIVAGMADATIVIETATKGGSMITAELAYNYNRDLFAIPGRITDAKSSGCLQLIKQNKAILLHDTEQLLETMGWQQKKKVVKKQQELFIELSAEEKILVAIIQEQVTVNIDELYFKSGLSSSKVATAILNLELNNVIMALPGKMYQLI